jgi:hypothetical protein
VNSTVLATVFCIFFLNLSFKNDYDGTKRSRKKLFDLFTIDFSSTHVIYQVLFFQFEDPYRKPPKFWRFCDFPTIANSDVSDHDGSIVLQSYLNVFRVTQVTRDVATPKRLRFRVKASAVQDEDLALKVRTWSRVDLISVVKKSF